MHIAHEVNVYASTKNTTATNSLTTSASAATALAAAGHHDIRVRPQVCPMCEATFPAVDVTHELFVDHVKSMVVPAFIMFSFYYWSGLTVYTSNVITLTTYLRHL